MEYKFDIDELIAKRLATEIGDQELVLLEKWLAESPDNRFYFSQMERLWQQSEIGKGALPRALDVEAALAKTKSSIQLQPTNRRAIRIRLGSRWMAAAAALLLLVSAIVFFDPFNRTTIQEIAALTTIQQDTLSDGSVVALNQYSNLTASFSKNTRRIKMRGEAYFQVVPNPEKPFVVDVQQVKITVIGTKFNVDNRSDSSKVIISVEEGKVRVQSGDQVLYLTVGDQATIDCVTGLISRKALQQASNMKGWIDRRFVFDDVPLSEVIPILENVYQVQIALKNKELGNCLLHARFNDEPIEQVLDVIKQTFSLQIENNNGRYQVDGAGCGK
jgi:ferric-dicitrate binding protein FerR (iron transport regulator)